MVELMIVDEDGNEEVRDVTGLKALDILKQCLLDGKEWSVNYDGATETEQKEWFQSDFYYRAYRAVNFRGKPIVVDGIEHVNVIKAAETIRMAILSGLGITMVEDDDNGLVVNTASPDGH